MANSSRMKVNTPVYVRGVRARRTADRRLIDLDHLVDQIDAIDARVPTRLIGRRVQRARQRLIENLVHQGRLSRSADARHSGQQPQRDRNVHSLEIVGVGSPDDDLALPSRAPVGRDGDRALPPQVEAREGGVAVLLQLVRRALEHHVAAMLACSGSQVDHVIGRSNRLLVMLDNNDRVLQVAEARQRIEEAPVVALVQADRRLIEHVEDTGQAGADLCREADSLPLSARQRGRAPREREVPNADIVQEMEPILDLAQDAACDDLLARGRLQPLEHFEACPRSAD